MDLGAVVFHELAQGLAGPVAWGTWPDEATGFTSKIARRKSILESLLKKPTWVEAALRRVALISRSGSESEIANFSFLLGHRCLTLRDEYSP